MVFICKSQLAAPLASVDGDVEMNQELITHTEGDNLMSPTKKDFAKFISAKSITKTSVKRTEKHQRQFS